MSFNTRFGQLRAAVATYSSLPVSGNVKGDVRIATDTSSAYSWSLTSSTGTLSDWSLISSATFENLLGTPASSLAIDDAVLSIKGLSINIALMAFEFASKFSWLSLKLMDGFVDKFMTPGSGNTSAVNQSASSGFVKLSSQQLDVQLQNTYVSDLDFYMPYRGDLDSNTIMLIHGDGDNGSTSFTDLLRNTITSTNVTTDTTTKKFGTGSLAFNGTSSYISMPDVSVFSFGTNDFTIDMWVNFSSLTNAAVFIGQYVDSTHNWSFSKGTNAAGNKLAIVFKNGTTKADYIMTSASSLATSTWYHLAVVRNTTSVVIYIDGVAQSLTTNTAISTNDVGNLAAPLLIGQQNSTSFISGNIDEIRMSSIARYTSSPFTPLTRSYNEVVGSSPSYALTDSSSSAHTLTAHGNTRLSGNNLSFGNASLYVDGIDSYVTSTDSADWKLDTSSNYTVDCWIDTLNYTDLNAVIIGQDGAWSLAFDGSSNHYLKFNIVGGNTVTAPLTIALDTWYHIAIVCNSGTITFYINGVSRATVASSTITDSSSVLAIGATSAGANFHDGYIEEVRISNTARWTTNFTPPTSAYTSDANTKLLAHFNVVPVENMVINSDDIVANYTPSSVRVVVFEEDIQAIEPNTDLTAEISRDGGATYTSVILAKDSSFDDGQLNIFTGSSDLSLQPVGTLMRYRIKTLNNKDCRLRGISLQWSK